MADITVVGPGAIGGNRLRMAVTGSAASNDIGRAVAGWKRLDVHTPHGGHERAAAGAGPIQPRRKTGGLGADRYEGL